MDILDILTGVLLCSLSLVPSSVTISNGTNALFRTLISDDYNPDIRPCLDCSTPLNIGVTFHLTSLNKIDEIEGELNTVGFLTLVWVDERLTWNPLLNGVGYILLPSSKTWKPPILLGNPARAISRLNADDALVRVLYNGTMIWHPGDVFQSRCAYDVYNYPFDKQSCWIAFTPWSYLASEIRLFAPDDHVKTPFYQEHGGWMLGHTSTDTYTSNDISFVQFDITFIRRSEFFVVNIILPLLFLSILDCLAFAIPIESGERVSYTITILLSFAVFMTLVGDNIPKTSAPISLLCYFLVSLFIGSVLVMMCVIVNMRVFYTDSSIKMSSAFIKISKMLKCCEQRNKYTIRIRNVDDNHTGYSVNIPEIETNMSDSNITWRNVSSGLDRLCLLFSLLYYGSITLGMIIYSTKARFDT